VIDCRMHRNVKKCAIAWCYVSQASRLTSQRQAQFDRGIALLPKVADPALYQYSESRVFDASNDAYVIVFVVVALFCGKSGAQNVHLPVP